MPLILPPSPQAILPGSPLDWSHPLAQRLAAWWLVVPGQDGGIILRDLTGQNHGTLTGMAAPPTSTSGWNRTIRQGGDGALACDGTNDFVDCGNGSSLDGSADLLTISAWVNPSSFAYDTVISNYNSAGDLEQYGVYVASTAHATFEWDGPGTIAPVWATPDNSLTAGVWAHLVCVRTGHLASGDVTIFINGVSQTLTLTGSLGEIPAQVDVGNTAMGRAGSFNGLYYSGSLDDVRIYHRALSATEAQQLYINSRQSYPDLLNRVRQRRFITLWPPACQQPAVSPLLRVRQHVPMGSS